MKRGTILAVCLLLASCVGAPERVALEPFKISFEPPPLEIVEYEEPLVELPFPAELTATFPDFDPIGANVSLLEAVLVNLPAAIPISVERRRIRGRMRTVRRYPIAIEAQTTDPVLALSRMTVSEEGWESPDGMGAIFQVVRNTRSSECHPENHSECEDGRETWISAMRRASPRVTGQRNPTRRRQLWTSTLPRGDSETGPPYWRECPLGPEGTRLRRQHLCEGRWDSYRRFWNEIQAEGEGWLARRRGRGPCRGTPMSWGCPDCGDTEFMARRNRARIARGLDPYVVLDCGETHDIFYGIPPTPEPTRVELFELPEILGENPGVET